MKFGGTGWNWMSSGNSSCKKDFSVRRWLSKIQVLFDRMGQEERIVQVGVVITIDRSFSLCTM